MSIPAQVKQAAEAAERQLAQLYAVQQGTQEPQSAPQGDAGTQAPPQEGDNAPSAADTQFSAQDGAPQGEPAPEQPPAPEAPAEEPGWEQKYKTLQGMYNKEVPVLRRQVQQMEADMEAMRRLLAQMHASQAAPPSASAPASPPAKRRVTDAEVKDYGEELIDVVQRASLDAFEPYVSQLEAKLARFEQMVGGVAQHTQQSARAVLFDKLTAAVPNWEHINKSGEFLSWLDQADPYAGVPRQAMLTQAFENNDVARVVAFFKGFLRDSGAASEPEQRAPTSPPAAGRADLRSMVSPGAARSSTTTPSKSNERVWSQRDIANFYNEVMSGKYRDNAAKKDAIEREIIAAVNEGRVRN